jgi:adenosylhomocysteinase
MEISAEVTMMASSRIKDLGLAARIDAGRLAWHRQVTPITGHFAQQIARRDYRGKRLAYWGHITFQNAIPMMLALHEAGAEIAMGACNVDSTDDVAAAFLVSRGIRVYGWQGMSRTEYQENLALVRSFDADYLCDMGGELCVAYLDRNPPVKGALEATMSGLHLLRKHALPFPVFDWNSIPLKDLHNRYHVGDTLWPAFSQVTGMALYGRRVLVVGCGPVGKGIAERARALGAVVLVSDLDPVRLLDARHLGCEAVSLDEGLKRCDVVVTATGVEGVLGAEKLRDVRPGAILFNAGHSNREIDIDWLYRQPHERLQPHIERFDLGETHLFLLAGGSLLNLAGGAGPLGVDQFDHYTAVMLLGIAWMFDGIPDDITSGLQRYPAHLERQIAELSVKIHNA